MEKDCGEMACVTNFVFTKQWSIHLYEALAHDDSRKYRNPTLLRMKMTRVKSSKRFSLSSSIGIWECVFKMMRTTRPNVNLTQMGASTEQDIHMHSPSISQQQQTGT